jgi:membrane protease YdiL (CAAX protease family)
MVTQQPSSLQAFIQRHPVPIYYVLTYALSWGVILLVIGPEGFLGTKAIPEARLPLVYLAMLVGPSIAGILLTDLVSGRRGLYDLLSRMLRWRVGVRWYAVALLTAPLLITAILLALSLASSAFLPAIITSTDRVSLLVSGIVAGLMVGFFEELGWTGFAVPELRKRYGLLATGLIMGLLWGAWHFPLFWAGARSSGELPSVFLLLVLLFSFLPPYRVLMVCVYDRTKGLPVVVLMHAPLVASQMILIPVLAGMSVVTYDLLFATTLWVVVAAVWLRSRYSRKR